MKFWEVLSGFRNWREVVLRVLNLAEWQEPYLGWYHRRNELVEDQNREILDALVPAELTREIVKQIPEYYFFDEDSRNLRANQVGMSESDNVIRMTALEVHDQFGGAFIEEIQEYGSAVIPREL